MIKYLENAIDFTKEISSGKVVVDLSLVGEYQAAQSEMEQIPENISDVERNKQLA